MIKYFIKTGGESAQIFSDYVWGESGFASVLEKLTHDKIYSDSLELLLIKYLVDGEVIEFKESKKPVSKYSIKTRDISVDINVRKNDFINKPPADRSRFIAMSTLNAIENVEKELTKSKIEINLSDLRNDIQKAANIYLTSNSN